LTPGSVGFIVRTTKLLPNKKEAKQEKAIFQDIFNDHWEGFKAKYTNYDNKRY